MAKRRGYVTGKEAFEHMWNGTGPAAIPNYLKDGTPENKKHREDLKKKYPNAYKDAPKKSKTKALMNKVSGFFKKK